MNENFNNKKAEREKEAVAYLKTHPNGVTYDYYQNGSSPTKGN